MTICVLRWFPSIFNSENSRSAHLSKYHREWCAEGQATQKPYSITYLKVSTSRHVLLLSDEKIFFTPSHQDVPHPVSLNTNLLPNSQLVWFNETLMRKFFRVSHKSSDRQTTLINASRIQKKKPMTTWRKPFVEWWTPGYIFSIICWTNFIGSKVICSSLMAITHNNIPH